ncbi:TVP38/TMEM64 family protein [Aliiglaciecola lipolytica]|nr:VTT domain-containing protein [Aliiglaciecola lipolytica]
MILIKSGIAFVAISLAVIVGWKFGVSTQQITEGVEYVQSFGVWSVVVFCLVYVTLVCLSFPSSIFNIAAGILFGFAIALPVALACGLAAAVSTFLISRHFIHDFISDKIEKTKNGSQLLSLINKHTAKFIIMLRLNPFIPAVVKNYGLGVTNIRLFTYVWATLLGQLPLTTLYVYLGWIGGHSMLNTENTPDTANWLVLGVGGIISIMTLLISKYYVSMWLEDTKTQQE